MCVRELIEHLQQMPLKSEVGMVIPLAEHHKVEDIVRRVFFLRTQGIDEREYTNIVILSGETHDS